MARGGGGTRQQQHAAGILIEPVYQAGAVLEAEAQAVQQCVDMARHARAALYGKAGGLVDRQHHIVAVEHPILGRRPIRLTRRGRVGSAFCRSRRFGRERRHPHLISGGETQIRLGAAPVDPDLTGAQ